jgi:hypothetical protein
LRKTVGYLWALPNSVLGLAIGVVCVLRGGRLQMRAGCIEFFGAPVARLLRWTPLGARTVALTLGHVILGQSAERLDAAREHEHVHVGQYERWGPFFLFAYLGCSAWLWLLGRDPYRDNPFERIAYQKAPLPEASDAR